MNSYAETYSKLDLLKASEPEAYALLLSELPADKRKYYLGRTIKHKPAFVAEPPIVKPKAEPLSAEEKLCRKRERDKVWRQQNRDRKRELNKKWRETHKQEVRDYARTYTKNRRVADPEKARSYARSCYRARQDKLSIVSEFIKFRTDKVMRAYWGTEHGTVQKSLGYTCETYTDLSPKQQPRFTFDIFVQYAQDYIEHKPCPLNSKPDVYISEELTIKTEELFSKALNTLKDYRCIIDIFRNGDSTLDNESFTYMHEVYAKGKELRKDCTALMSEAARDLRSYYNKHTDLLEDRARWQDLFYQVNIIWSLKSALLAATWESGHEGYLYSILHRRDQWKRKNIQERSLTEKKRAEDFKAFDKFLKDNDLTSSEYWTLKNSSGRSKVDIEGSTLDEASLYGKDGDLVDAFRSRGRRARVGRA